MIGLKLQHLRFFVAVYEEQSITAAAKKINATQSGVSMQVRDLEEILGLQLFERGSTGVLPTKAGDQIYLRAARIFREVGGFEEDVATYSDQLFGTVRAGIMPTFARSVLAPVLSRFSRQHPYIDVKVTEGYSRMLTEMVADGDLDLAVVPGGEMLRGVQTTYLDTDVEVLVSAQSSSNGEASENGGGAKPQIDLSTAPPLKLVLPGPQNVRRTKIDQYLQNNCSSVHKIMELDSMMCTLDLISGGEWSSVLPGCLCFPDIDHPKIKHYPISRPSMNVDYLLIMPAAKAASAAAQLFADELSDEIRSVCEKCRVHFAQPPG